MDAKYKDSKNWLRVSGLFAQVKADIIAEVKTLKLPDEEIASKVRTLEGIQLIPPYPDKRRIEPNASCDSTQENAYYDPTHKVFTVCAGLFNSMQSEKALYAVMAHEVGHSIDPQQFADDHVSQTSKIDSLLSPLVHSKTSPTIPCEKWNGALKQMALEQNKFTVPNFDSMQKFYDCLAPKTGLQPLTPENVNRVANLAVKSHISSLATKKLFTYLAQPTKLNEDGESKPNDFTLRPDLLLAALDGNLIVQNDIRSASSVEIFVQDLACVHKNIDGKDVTYQNAPPGQRKELFSAAIEDLTTIVRAQVNDEYSNCGRNCSGLQKYSLSVNSQENFADWIAQRALTRRLTRLPTTEQRRDAIGLAFSFFCRPPSALSLASDLTTTEKQFSQEVHPDDRPRQLALYSDRNAKLAQCEITPAEQGNAKCEP